MTSLPICLATLLMASATQAQTSWVTNVYGDPPNGSISSVTGYTIFVNDAEVAMFNVAGAMTLRFTSHVTAPVMRVEFAAGRVGGSAGPLGVDFSGPNGIRSQVISVAGVGFAGSGSQFSSLDVLASNGQAWLPGNDALVLTNGRAGNYRFSDIRVTAVPEPGSAALLLAGVAMFAALRRRPQSQPDLRG